MSYGYVGGGLDSINATMIAVDRIETTSGTVNQLSNSLSHPRSAGAGLASKTAGYWCGGAAAFMKFTTVDKLSFANDNIGVNLSGLTGTRSHAGGFEGPGHGYVCGGIGLTDTSIIDHINFTDDKIVVLVSALSAPRASVVGSFASSQNGYVAGGANAGVVAMDSIEKLIFADETTGPVASSLSRTRTHGCASFESNFAGYACGGLQGSIARVSSIDKLTFATENVTVITSNLAASRSQGAGFAVKKGYCCGGNDDDPTDVIDCLNFTNDSVSVNSSTLTSPTWMPVGAFESD